MTTIGRGAIVLRPGRDPVDDERILTVLVTTEGVEVYDHAGGPDPQALVDVVSNLDGAGEVGSGHLAITALPATPSDAFDGLTVQVGDAGTVLRVRQADPFGPEAGPTLSDLDLTLTDPGAGESLVIAGSVTLHLGNDELVLQAMLDGDGRLRFVMSDARAIELPAQSSLEVTELEVGNDLDDPWEGLLALYTFDEQPDPDAEVDLVVHDRSLVVDGDGALDPVDLVGRVSPASDDRPRGVATGGGGGLRSPEVAAKLSAMGGGGGAHQTDEVTVEAWIINRAAPPNDRKPARIVSLSHSHDTRNLTLGLDKVPSSGETLYEGRLRTTTSTDGTPGIISSRPQPLDRPTMVVMTRGRTTPTDEDAGRIYVDGTDATLAEGSGDRRGGFKNWEPFHLMLGNEDGVDRAWDGEFLRVAIYNRELSADEVRQRHQASVRYAGSLQIPRMPMPFDRVFPVAITPSSASPNGRLQTALDASVGPLAIAPGFTVDQVVLSWPDPAGIEAGAEVTGTAVVSLWGEVFDVQLRLTRQALYLTAADPGRRTIDLGQGRGNEPIGRIQIDGLTIRADRRANEPGWTITADGDVRVLGFAPPLDQAFPLEVFLHEGEVMAGSRPAAADLPLPFFDDVAFAAVDLRYRLTGANRWSIEADDDRPDRRGVVLPLLGRDLALVPAPVEAGKAPTGLSWSRSDAASSRPVGVTDPAALTLRPNPRWETQAPFWAVDLLATLALGPATGAEPDIARLDLTLADGALERDPQPTPNRLTLTGQVALRHHDDTLLTGSWRRGAAGGFRVDGGRFRLYPSWSTVLVDAEAVLGIAADGTIHSRPAGSPDGAPAPSPVEGYTAPAYPLTEPSLMLSDGRLTMRGRWPGLPEPQAFHATERDRAIHLAAGDGVELPFTVDLPAMVDEATGALLRSARPLSSRMTMAIRTELQRTGYLAVVDGSFPAPSDDAAGAAADAAAADDLVRLPSLRIYDSPATPNAILGRLVDQLVQHSGQLLAGQVAGAGDYHVVAGPTDLRLAAGSGSARSGRATVLPRLFRADVVIGEADAPIRLVQSGDTCTLTVAVDPGATTDAVEAAVADFHRLVAELPTGSGPLAGGAVPLLRRRLTERLPLDYHRLLAHHYGWDPERGTIDLHPGMRLRIDPQPYQFVPPAVGRARSGRVATGTIHVPITSYVHRAGDGTLRDLVGFGPFLSGQQRQGRPDLATDGVGAAVDIAGPAHRRAFYRLLSPLDPSTGGGPERLATIIGHDTLAQLDAATEDVLRDGELDGGGSSFFFRGQAGVTPEIQVFLDGRPVWVPIGTTVRQLVETTDEVPTSPVSGPDPGRILRSRPLRLIHEGPSSEPHYRFVNLDPDPARFTGDGDGGGAGGAVDALDLPLIKGDRVRS